MHVRYVYLGRALADCSPLQLVVRCDQATAVLTSARNIGLSNHLRLLGSAPLERKVLAPGVKVRFGAISLHVVRDEGVLYVV